jgi:hypothetical protein
MSPAPFPRNSFSVCPPKGLLVALFIKEELLALDVKVSGLPAPLACGLKEDDSAKWPSSWSMEDGADFLFSCSALDA